MSKISVLLCESEDARFSAYCQERGFKKSTLIARLVREHLDGEGFALQARLNPGKDPIAPSRSQRLRPTQ